MRLREISREGLCIDFLYSAGGHLHIHGTLYHGVLGGGTHAEGLLASSPPSWRFYLRSSSCCQLSAHLVRSTSPLSSSSYSRDTDRKR